MNKRPNEPPIVQAPIVAVAPTPTALLTVQAIIAGARPVVPPSMR